MDDTERADAERRPSPVVKRGDEAPMRAVDAGEGMSKAVLLDETDGTPRFSMRRFALAPGARVPKHTNEVEHEQFVLSGTYTVGIEEASPTPPEDGDAVAYETHTVEAGDALFIPAGAVHWYRNDGDEPGAFVCVVPNGDDTIRVLENE